MNSLPAAFVERLEEIIPQEHFQTVLKSFSEGRVLSVRINTLKIPKDSLLEILRKRNINFSGISWCPDALILHNIILRELTEDDLVKGGLVYPQSLASMLVPLILEPKPDERILDMCAAPGSKATQMAGLMRNQGEIVCVENIRKRFFKLKSVISILGAENIRCHCLDGRRYNGGKFDKILVDAPCSAEGMFSALNPKTYFYWSLRKIKEMRKKQKGLLWQAARLLKPGGTLLYSTCTFSPEENEAVVDWVLKKTKGELKLVPVFIEGIASYPSFLSWGGKSFSDELKYSLRILPNEGMDGFFIAKMIKGEGIL